MTGHLLGELVGLPGSSEDEITEIEREITGISDKLHIHCRSAIDKAFEQRDPDSRIESWQQFFIDLAKLRAVSAHRVWYLFVHHPGQIATSFRLRKSNDWPLRTLAEQYEAWYLLAVNKNVPYVVERDAADGAAYLARTRWRLLSAFFRPEFGSSGPEPDRLISPRQQKTVGQWAERARAAREQWLSVLSEIDSHPTLRDRIDCEAEAVLLASIEIDAKVHARVRSDSPTARQKDDRGDQARRNGPLGGQPSNALSADPDRRAIAGYVATQLLLPRFAWHRSWTVVRQLCGRRLLNHWIGTAALFTVALVTFTLTAAGVLDTWGYTTATAIALLGYGLIAVGAALNRELGWPWLLRQPASSAVGLLALAALPADWWATSGSGTVLRATVLLTVVGLAYLAIEASNHGVSGRPLAARIFCVGALGLIHAALVSLIGLRLLLPAFATGANGKSIACWWTATGCGDSALSPWQMLLAATAWSFVSGVFLQILWDDQPITAPLSHVAWKVRK